MILPLTLMAFVVLGALSAALLAVGSSEVQIAGNHLHGMQAFYVAEAGAERALAQFVATPSLVTNATPASCPAPAAPSVVMTNGTATVTYACTVGPATILITSLGDSAGAQRVVRVVATTAFVSKYAILADQVEVGGNGRVQGSSGAIHGNSETEVEGSAFVLQTATSASNTCGGCTDVSRVGQPGASGPNKPVQTIPLANPMDFLPIADFVFGDGTTVVNGITVPVNKILRRSDNQLINAGTPPFAGWNMQNPGEWTFSGGTTPPNGTYYASHEIKITASPGSAGSPWRATFVAGTAGGEGEVEIAGHPNIVAYLQDLLVIAGEVDVRGTGGDASLTGTIITSIATAEVEMEGGVNLTGNIISTGEVDISGNVTVTYDGANVIPIAGPLQVLSWSSG